MIGIQDTDTIQKLSQKILALSSTDKSHEEIIIELILLIQKQPISKQ